MKVKVIPPMEAVRCMAWVMCPVEACDHHRPHRAVPGCCFPNQVKYCPHVEGFVTDILITDFDSTLASDPNMAFKAHKDYR
jgi:hypothetical protein